jgi:hypothetical protein
MKERQDRLVQRAEVVGQFEVTESFGVVKVR